MVMKNMLYMLKTPCNDGDGIADIEQSAKKVKDAGGCLVLSDFTTFRSVPQFLKICRGQQCNHAVGMDVDLWDGVKKQGRVTLMAFNDSGILALSRILTKINLLEFNKQNTEWGDSQFSAGKNTFGKVALIDDVIRNKDDLCLVYSDRDFDFTEDKLNNDSHTKLRDAFGKMAFGGLKSDGEDSSVYDDTIYNLMGGRVVSTVDVKLNGNTERDVVLATSHSRGLKKRCTFRRSDSIEHKHSYYNEVVKKNTESLVGVLSRASLSVDENGNHLYGTILRKEESPDLGMDLTFVGKSYENLDAYLKLHGKEDERFEYTKMLEKELSLVDRFGFGTYYEAVASTMAYFKDELDVSVRIRGSAASSMVMFLLGDWDKMVNPKDAKLDLDRFLGERTTKMTDIDIDVPHMYREEFFKYVESILQGGRNDKYRVAALTTEGRVKGLSASLRFAYAGYADTIGKKEGMYISPKEFDNAYSGIKSAFDKTRGSNWKKSISDIKKDTELNNVLNKSMATNDPRFKELFSIAMDLVGLNTTVLSHPSGVVISGKGRWFDLPLIPLKGGRFAVQADGAEDAPNCGLVKFDILASRNITLIETAEKHISERYGKVERSDLFNTPFSSIDFLLKNPEFVNQFNGKSVQHHLEYVKPTDMDGLINAIAIRNPAISSADRDLFKKNRRTNSLVLPMGIEDPTVKKIFAPTCGIYILDEQILDIGKEFANLNGLDSADLLTGVRKNKPKLIDGVKDSFVNGAIAKGKTRSGAEQVFGFIKSLAGKYSFCKAHAYSYLYVSLEQSELKRKYPAEFMQGAMEAYVDNQSSSKRFSSAVSDRLCDLVDEYKKRGIGFKSPSINDGDITCCKLVTEDGCANIYYPVSQTIADTEMGTKMVSLLCELKESGELLNLDLMGLAEIAFVEVTGLSMGGVGVSGNEVREKTSEFIELLEGMIVTGCFDDIVFDVSDSLDCEDYLSARDQKEVRGLHLGRTKWFVSSLALYEEYNTFCKVELSTNDLIDNDKNIFGNRLSAGGFRSPVFKNMNEPNNLKPTKCMPTL